MQGLEPRTLRIWAACSNRLSYTATCQAKMNSFLYLTILERKSRWNAAISDQRSAGKIKVSAVSKKEFFHKREQSAPIAPLAELTEHAEKKDILNKPRNRYLSRIAFNHTPSIDRRGGRAPILYRQERFLCRIPAFAGMTSGPLPCPGKTSQKGFERRADRW